MISNFDKAVTELIMTKRRDKGITQEQLGEALCVDASFISNIERYEKKYNVEHLGKLSKLFECSPKELIPDIYEE